MSRVLLLAILVALLLFPTAAGAGASGLVVSQIYGGGGNAGATFRNDYVELFNAGSGVVDLSGWTVQYATAAGTTWQAPHSPGRSRPATTTWSSSHRTRTSAPPFRPPMRPARATSVAPAGKSHSFAVSPHSRAALRRGVVRPIRSWRISSATAAPATSRVRARRRGFPTLRPRFARTMVAPTRATTRPTSRRRHPRPGTQPPRRTCARARPPGRAGP